jgi:ATP-dependent Clp protease adaptor protein ClpS
MSTRWDNDSGIVTEKKTATKTKRPPLYKVLLHNDHYTTREFVVDVLRTVFHKSESESVQIMMHVHLNGVGLAGVYPFEIAETKVKTVERLAREYEFPLHLSIEPED